MLFASLRRHCSAAVTNSVATHTAGTRGVHRPKIAAQEQRKHRLRQRRQHRRRNIAAKEAEVQRSIEHVTSSRDVLVGQLADQIFARGHRHVATATNAGFVPDGNPATPLVALCGREGCGKTALLRSLFRSANEVGRSNRRLRRDAMNFFNVGDVFHVVDLPGFGGTSVPWSTVLQHAVLLRNFARCQPSLKMLYYCMDVNYKHGLYIQDVDLLRFLSREIPNFTVVITKADQINDRARHTIHLEEVRRELLYNDIHQPVLVTSAYHMGGVDTLRYDMVMNCLHAVPTERLTLTEARRLSARLFSQKELSTIGSLAIAPTQVDEERQQWVEEIRLHERVAERKEGVPELPANAEDTGTAAEEEEEEENEAEARKNGVHVETEAEDLPYSDTEAATFEDAAAEAPLGDVRGETEVEGLSSENVAGKRGPPNVSAVSPLTAAGASTIFSSSTDSTSGIPVVFDDPVTQLAYARVVKTLRNKPLLRYVDATSPWRNPLRWPRHVVPTKHPKSNIMRCPEAPENPYLYQPQFVVPRADLCFRRPNVGVRKSSMKGRYEPDRPLAFLMKHYTIPYFPDIVDTAMQPTPWAFLGSREAYYERSSGRQLGVRLVNYATQGTVNPLSDNPAPEQPEVTKELQKLETIRYGAPIAMLRPPEMESVAMTSSEAVTVSDTQAAALPVEGSRG